MRRFQIHFFWILIRMYFFYKRLGVICNWGLGIFWRKRNYCICNFSWVLIKLVNKYKVSFLPEIHENGVLKFVLFLMCMYFSSQFPFLYESSSLLDAPFHIVKYSFNLQICVFRIHPNLDALFIYNLSSHFIPLKLHKGFTYY